MTTKASQITSLMVVYSTVYSDADQRKHQSSASLAFVWGIHRDRWIPRTKCQLRGKCFHLMTSSWKYGTGTRKVMEYLFVYDYLYVFKAIMERLLYHECIMGVWQYYKLTKVLAVNINECIATIYSQVPGRLKWNFRGIYKLLYWLMAELFCEIALRCISLGLIDKSNCFRKWLLLPDNKPYLNHCWPNNLSPNCDADILGHNWLIARGCTCHF